jgi:hypothetical protein
MKTSKNPLLVCDGVARFLEETLVRSLEGALFAAVSAVFTLTVIAAVFAELPVANSGTPAMASTASDPALAARAEFAPRQLAAVRDVSQADSTQ